ncbi:MAG: hypothetical protein VX830_12130 [Candidatus Poribacteria bacterium]|nr:hypothetical protein [Candidatus Poribacteria bacterium]
MTCRITVGLEYFPFRPSPSTTVDNQQNCCGRPVDGVVNFDQALGQMNCLVSRSEQRKHPLFIFSHESKYESPVLSQISA